MTSVWDIEGVVDCLRERIDAMEAPATIARVINTRFRAAFNKASLSGVTRNSVISKIHRLGLASRQVARRPRSRVPLSKPAVERRAPPRRAAAAVAAPAPRPEEFVPSRDFIAPEELRIYEFRLLDTPRTKLGERQGVRHCRYIEGDPRGLFIPGNKTSFLCGCRALVGQPYCAQHKAMSYGTLTKRQEQLTAAKQKTHEPEELVS